MKQVIVNFEMSSHDYFLIEIKHLSRVSQTFDILFAIFPFWGLYKKTDFIVTLGIVKDIHSCLISSVIWLQVTKYKMQYTYLEHIYIVNHHVKLL